MQVPRICLSNKGTPRRAEKLCHFHIFRPALTSPVSREIHLRSNLNFKPVKFYIAVGSRPRVFAAGTGNKGVEKDLEEFVCTLPFEGMVQRRRGEVCV